MLAHPPGAGGMLAHPPGSAFPEELICCFRLRYVETVAISNSFPLYSEH